MVENKKALLVKVDIVDNMVDSLTKFVSTTKFSWCREVTGITTLS